MLVHDPARDRAARWARDLVDRSDWAILDTETTGLDASAEVIQVAIVGPDAAILLDTLIRPSGRIPPDAVAIHGIGNDRVAGAPTYAEVHPVIGAILQGKVAVCYNAAFDSRLLRQTAIRYRLAPHRVTWDCAMEMYARYAGEWSPRRGGYRYPKLPRGPAYRGQNHQAVDDCLATLDLIRRMAGAESVRDAELRR